MARRSKAWLCYCSVARSADSIVKGDMDVCIVNAVCCQVEVFAKG